MTPEPSEQPEVVAVAMQHARRGVLLQVVLRWVLVGFVALTVLTVPLRRPLRRNRRGLRAVGARGGAVDPAGA